MLTWPDLVCPEQIGGTPDAPVLLGNRCRNCGEPYFPAARGCTRCTHVDLEPVELGANGILWSWTTQLFRPKVPYDGVAATEPFRPFGIGYVELPGGLRIEARLVGEPPFAIGQAMRLVLEPYRASGAHGPVFTYAFEAAA